MAQKTTGYFPITPEELRKSIGPTSTEAQKAAAEKTIGLYTKAVENLTALDEMIGEFMYNPEKKSPKGIIEGLKKYDADVHGRIKTAEKDTAGDKLIGPLYKTMLAEYSGRLSTRKSEAMPAMWTMQYQAVRNADILAADAKKNAENTKNNTAMLKSLPELLKELDDIGTVKKG
ncbi:MAG: hypothetical protein NT016_03240 [Candidatus Aenigmarchaeota archaeon]|nr:hypothetical protein [Candidatus Aenigmarchaeota archaeon]